MIFNLFPHIKIPTKPTHNNEGLSDEESPSSVADNVMFELNREGAEHNRGAAILRRLRKETGVPP